MKLEEELQEFIKKINEAPFLGGKGLKASEDDASVFSHFALKYDMDTNCSRMTLKCMLLLSLLMRFNIKSNYKDEMPYFKNIVAGAFSRVSVDSELQKLAIGLKGGVGELKFDIFDQLVAIVTIVDNQ